MEPYVKPSCIGTQYYSHKHTFDFPQTYIDSSPTSNSFSLQDQSYFFSNNFIFHFFYHLVNSCSFIVNSCSFISSWQSKECIYDFNLTDGACTRACFVNLSIFLALLEPFCFMFLLLKDEWLLQNLPRYQPGNLEQNALIFEHVKNMAQRKGCTPSQLALAWVHHQGNDVCPIPGTTKIENLNQNIRALSVELTPEEMSELELCASADAVKGNRNADANLVYSWRNSETPSLSSWKGEWCFPLSAASLVFQVADWRWLSLPACIFRVQ